MFICWHSPPSFLGEGVAASSIREVHNGTNRPVGCTRVSHSLHHRLARIDGLMDLSCCDFQILACDATAVRKFRGPGPLRQNHDQCPKQHPWKPEVVQKPTPASWHWRYDVQLVSESMNKDDPTFQISTNQASVLHSVLLRPFKNIHVLCGSTGS